MNENDIVFDNTQVNAKSDIIFNNEEVVIIPTSYDLIFDNANPSKNNNFYFGGEGIILIPSTIGVLNLSQKRPTFKGTGYSSPLSISGFLSLKAYIPKLSVKSFFDVNNPLELLDKQVNSFQKSTIINKPFFVVFKGNDICNFTATYPFQKSIPIGTKVTSDFLAQVGYPINNLFTSAFEKTKDIIEAKPLFNFQDTEILDISKNQSSQKAYPLNAILYKSNLQEGSITSYHVYSLLQEAVDVEKTNKADFNVAELATNYFNARFQLADNLGNPTTKIDVKPPVIELEKNNDIIFECLAKNWEKDPYNYTIIFNDTCELKIDRPTDYSEPIFVKNTFTLKNLETGQEIKATDLSFSTDVDSYAWTGSMTIPDNQVEFLKSPTNKAVLIEYIFNDIKAVFQVGKVSRNITFGQRSYKVKLSSPSIKLDEPISGVNSYTNQDTLTPSAYAEKLIDPTNNGINLIWDFLSPLEWVINKGAFTYQNLSPIKAIGSMLENSGAFISSSLDGKNLIVKRKRPIVFWEEIDSSKIINIPTGVITSLGYEIEHLQHFNGVYVLADDRTVFVRRRETNGAVLAPQIVAKQLTSNQACIEAGRYVLANAGIVETHDLAKPILNDGVLLNPADIVKFVLDDVTYIGTVISTSVAIKFNSQYQTFKVEVIKGFN